GRSESEDSSVRSPSRPSPGAGRRRRPTSEPDKAGTTRAFVERIQERSWDRRRSVNAAIVAVNGAELSWIGERGLEQRAIGHDVPERLRHVRNLKKPITRYGRPPVAESEHVIRQ